MGMMRPGPPGPLGERWPLRLELTQPEINNTTIASSTDIVYFEVITPKWTPTMTRVNKRNPETRKLEMVAELETKGYQSFFRFTDGDMKPTATWIKRNKKNLMPMSGQFTAPDGKVFEWEGTKSHLKLKSMDDPNTVLGTYFAEQRYMSFLRMKRHPYIELSAGAMDHIDTIIISFLLLKRKIKLAM